MPTGAPEPLTVPAADGYPIKGFVWRHREATSGRTPAVIINAATSVRCQYYFPFAAFLFAHGFDVIAYDYRGIGESRPATLRGFDASWIDWGHLDFDAMLRHAAHSDPGRPIHVVAHSIGGVLVGLAPTNHLIGRIFTMGAQYAYWPDYAAGRRLQMLAKWHVVMPLLTVLFGYFPGKRLGWVEDTPKGVVLDWTFSGARLEDTFRRRRSTRHPAAPALVQQFAAVTAPLLAVSVTDDEFGTIAAVNRPLAYFRKSLATHLRISPDAIGAPAIGHFGFFHRRFEQTLWPLALAWLTSGRLPADVPGVLIAPDQSGA